MFTKYNGVEIPRNYSGNRFSPTFETEMKTHRATANTVQQGTVKSSFSPSFQEVIDKTMNETVEMPVTDDEIQVTENTTAEITDAQNEEIVQASHSYTKEAQKSDFNLMGLLEKISKDDLLLIALIIVLASDSAEGGTDVILCLALLLLFR